MIATTPPELAAWLSTARQALIVDAYTLITPTGLTARWIDADFDFRIPAPDSRLFERGPVIERGSVKQEVGLGVDNLSLSVRPKSRGADVMLGTQTLLAAAQTGGLRGATLQLERLVFATGPADYQGLWVEFAGTLAVKNTAGGVIKADVLSELNLLDKPMPPDVYQAQCKNQVFDAQCGLDRSAWEVTGGVSALAGGSGPVMQFTSGLTLPDGYFNQGVVQFNSGLNAGVKRTVKGFASGVFSFSLPWPQALAVGDLFTAVPGCSRTLDTCRSKFNNALRYRGEPFIPQPETVN
jgi:uncharacterized phage protein (TIGR02218 family)